MTQTTYRVTFACQDRPGIVYAFSQGVVDLGGNIVKSAQYSDAQTGRFFIRAEVDVAGTTPEAVQDALSKQLRDFDVDLTVRDNGTPLRTLLMVSSLDHCLLDLLYRWRMKELAIDVVGIASNHDVTREAAERYGVPFHHVPITAETKAAAESQLLAIVESTDAELVVLARYMQVLTDDLCRRLQGRVINIHHSFLPAFKGAKPYHRAHARGVKLIGATAHYVTGDLDEGPIIQQDVVRVRHDQTVDALVAAGRDVEGRVLASAVKAHAEGRVFLNGDRTVVFD
ncbi:MAG: formyltetrahydrofolate deformylase [Actinobacteria bacterium]|nr:formyltetrahydrofolate deformylase [Actinomycetota bacterium]